MEKELLKLLPMREGHFQFASGHHGDLWIELDALFVHPNRLRPFVVELARRLATWRVEAICGPLTGGAFLAQMIAQEMDVGFCFTQGDEPIARAMCASVAGRRVAIVDDVINAGSAVSGAIKDLRACGATPFVIGALMVLGTSAPRLADEEGLALECIARRPGNLWEPAKCPLCAAGVVLSNA